MTCLLNTYGKISNLLNIIKYLNQKAELSAITDGKSRREGGLNLHLVLIFINF